MSNTSVHVRQPMDTNQGVKTRGIGGFFAGTAGILCFAAVFAFLKNSDTHSLQSPFGHGGDGLYSCDNPATPASFRINGSEAEFSFPGGIDVRNMHLDRSGATLRFTGGTLYQNGYIAPDQSLLQSGGSVDLATVGDDGQSISLQLPGGSTMRFIKQ